MRDLFEVLIGVLGIIQHRPVVRVVVIAAVLGVVAAKIDGLQPAGMVINEHHNVARLVVDVDAPPHEDGHLTPLCVGEVVVPLVLVVAAAAVHLPHLDVMLFVEGQPLRLDVIALDRLPAGADLAAVSMHKSGGSLTQSSVLLTGQNMDKGLVRQIINLTQTTSASYLLLSSLDLSRRNLALRGKECFDKVVEMAEYAREEINRIGGYYAYGRELVDGVNVFDYDVTKLCIYTRNIGLTGIEVYDLLRDEYDIQIEFGDLGSIMAYISIGDRLRDIERLVGALEDIKRLYAKDGSNLACVDFIEPEVVKSPKQSFYAEKVSMPLSKSAGNVCGEFVMCYPPGIPILAPGELITDEIIEHIVFSKEKGCSLQGAADTDVENIRVLK